MAHGAPQACGGAGKGAEGGLYRKSFKTRELSCVEANIYI